MLAVMCLALVVTGLDTLIVTVAIPSIEVQLHASAAALQWTVAAYSLAFASTLLFAGGLADRFGHRLFFILGMLMVLAGSVAAGLSSTVELLIGSRVVMGLGAAMIMPATLALIRHVFPVDERAKALGIWVAMASIGIPLGPIVGGLLLGRFGWGSVFFINVPLVVIALIGCLALIPESRGASKHRLDGVGLALSIPGPLLLVYGLIIAPTWGWTSPGTVGGLLAGVALVVAFVLWERRADSPMLNRSVFSDPFFGGPLITIAGVFFGIFGGLFLVTQHLQLTLGHSPLGAGLHMLAMCTAVVVAPVTPKLVEKFGLGAVTALGPLSVGAGLAVLSLSGSPSSTQVLMSLALLGLGVGFGAAPSVNSIVEATAADQTGAGSAVADVAMQLGGALGIAIIGSTAAVATTPGGPLNLSMATGIGAGVAILAAVAVLVTLRPQRIPEPAQT